MARVSAEGHRSPRIPALHVQQWRAQRRAGVGVFVGYPEEHPSGVATFAADPFDDELNLIDGQG